MSLLLERRIAPRRNTSILAKVAFNGTTRPCIIRNTSDTGAKIEVATVVDIPNTFDLLVPGHQPQLCRVVWRSLKEMGLAFEERR